MPGAAGALWGAVVFYVGRHMFVMRVGALQRWHVGMRLWIIPVQPLSPLADTVRVVVDCTQIHALSDGDGPVFTNLEIQAVDIDDDVALLR